MKRVLLVLAAICLLPMMLFAKGKKNEVSFRLNLKPGMEFSVVSENNSTLATSSQAQWGDVNGTVNSKQTVTVKCEVLAIVDTNIVISATFADFSTLYLSTESTTILAKDMDGKNLLEQPKELKNESKKTEEDYPWVRSLYGRQIKVVVTPHGEVVSVDGWEELIADLGEFAHDKSHEELLAEMQNRANEKETPKYDIDESRSKNILRDIKSAMQLTFLRGFYPGAPLKLGNGWTIKTSSGENHSTYTVASVNARQAKITSSVKVADNDKQDNSSLTMDVEGLYDLQTGLYDSLIHKNHFESVSNEFGGKMQTKNDDCRAIYIKH